jgi:hypothetical protein
VRSALAAAALLNLFKNVTSVLGGRANEQFVVNECYAV